MLAVRSTTSLPTPSSLGWAQSSVTPAPTVKTSETCLSPPQLSVRTNVKWPLSISKKTWLTRTLPVFMAPNPIILSLDILIERNAWAIWWELNLLLLGISISRGNSMIQTGCSCQLTRYLTWFIQRHSAIMSWFPRCFTSYPCSTTMRSTLLAGTRIITFDW